MTGSDAGLAARETHSSAAIRAVMAIERRRTLALSGSPEFLLQDFDPSAKAAPLLLDAIQFREGQAAELDVRHCPRLSVREAIPVCERAVRSARVRRVQHDVENCVSVFRSSGDGIVVVQEKTHVLQFDVWGGIRARHAFSMSWPQVTSRRPSDVRICRDQRVRSCR